LDEHSVALGRSSQRSLRRQDRHEIRAISALKAPCPSGEALLSCALRRRIVLGGLRCSGV